MPREMALGYLAVECAPENLDPAALEAEWNTAQGRIQAPLANVGKSAVRDIPDSHQAYVAGLVANEHWQQTFAQNPHWEIKMVEAAPLLAFQFSIMNGKADGHGCNFTTPPTLDELFNCCLPAAPTQENATVAQQPNAFLIQTRALNLQPLDFSPVAGQPGLFQLRVGVSLPFVHVVRFNGRCYLHNGYHRVLAALQRGAAEVPCVFRDVAAPQEIGPLGAGAFPLEVLESDNPPAMHHYASGQAHPVELVVKTRVVQLSLTNWVVPEI
jgi:hypothetical protein